MHCCKCEEYGWDDPQPVEYVDEAGRGYCLFHAPKNHKMVDGCPYLSTEAFNAFVFHRIDQVIAKSRRSRDAINCNMAGVIFLGAIDFSAYGAGSPVLSIDFSHGLFSAGSCFYKLSFGDKTSFGGAKFGERADFERATFGENANFLGAKFGDGASFGGAKFGERTLFVWATFGENAIFIGATFGDGAFFERATFGENAIFIGAKFGKKAFFGEAKFGKKAFFGEAKFKGDSDFTETAFKGTSSFSKTNFQKCAQFTRTLFSGEADFQRVEAKDNALRMNALDAESLENIHFTSLETELFSFKGCNWPKMLFLESGGLQSGSDGNGFNLDTKACEELYRSLKLKASSEHDQPMVSKWHYREKLMALEQVKNRYHRFWWLHWLGIYYWTSGFGEHWKPALKALGCMVIFCLLLLGLGGVHGGGFTIQGPALPTWENMQNFGSICMSLLKYLLLIKEDSIKFKPIYGAAEFFILLFTRLLIPLQAAFFAIALRNEYRR